MDAGDKYDHCPPSAHRPDDDLAAPQGEVREYKNLILHPVPLRRHPPWYIVCPMRNQKADMHAINIVGFLHEEE